MTEHQTKQITPEMYAKQLKCSEGFIRWIHTEGQYDEVEIP